MKSLELIRQLNEDPALRDSNGISARRLARRIDTLLEMGLLDPDALLFFGDIAVVAAVAQDDGEGFVLEVDGRTRLTGEEKAQEECYRLRACVDAAERAVEAWGRVGTDDAGAVDFDDLAEAAIEEMDALREAVADVKRQAAIAAEMEAGR